MSKSLGNFFTVRQILDGNAPLFNRAMTGNEIRMSFLLSHYRSTMDLSAKRLHEASMAVADFARMLGRGGDEVRKSLKYTKPLEEVVAALSDDLDSVSAVIAIREAAKNIPSDRDARRTRILQLYSSQRLLGFDLKDSPTTIDVARDKDELSGVVHRAVSEVLYLPAIASRINEARKERNYAEADRLRDALLAAGVEVKITHKGVETTRLPHFDPSKLEALK